MTDLSKAFDCLDHELLIAKLNAYGFTRSALLFVHGYLDRRKQRVKVNGSFSMWTKTSLGVPQGSALGPLLFNIYLNDLFLFLEETEVCNYADDTTIYTCGPNVENVVAKLENDALAISEWFPNNRTKLNEDKCHLMIFDEKSNKVSVKIGEANVKERKEEKLLGIIFDQTLSFKQHVKTLCKKASQKLHALARISCYMETEKLKQVMQALSHFSYSPLVWMFYDRSLNHRINHIHERALRFAYKDYQTDFGTLLKQMNLVSIHVKNLRLLMTEIYKTRSGLSPPFIKDIFAVRNTGYDLRQGNDSQLPKVHTTTDGHFLISKASTLSTFKSHIKCWKGENCNCRLCKIYIPQG